IDTSGTNVTLTGAISNGNSGSGDKIKLTNAGTLTLANQSPSYSGGWLIPAGTVIVNSADGSGISGLGVGHATFASAANSVILSGTGTLRFDNVNVGDPTTTTTAPEV